MKKNTVNKRLYGAMLTSVLGMSLAQAADPVPGIVGKNDWLFYRYELSDVVDTATTDASLDLIQRFNKVLSANGVSMAVTLVPLKMRIYSEYLPDNIKVNDYMASNYERMSKVLRTAQVNVIDLNTAFMNSPKRSSDTPLFFRLDTHWAPAGSMLAAEAIKAGIDGNAALKKVLDATPEEGFKLVLGKRKVNSKSRDLVEQLPKDSPVFAPEQFVPFSVSRAQPPKEDLLGNREPLGMTLVGSSYSHAWTGFPDALRYTLQRDMLSISVGADQGSWVGMEGYLRDDAFQSQTPKMVIWEMPERDLRAPPNYKFRDARYVSDNTEWLLRVSALVQASCKPSTVTAKLAPVGLAANAANLKGSEVATGPTNDADFIEVGFDKPVEKLDYLVARAVTNGSKTITLEGSGPGVATRRFTLNVAGDDMAHALKTPLPSNGNGFTKVRIFPGKSNGFALQGLQVCRQPEDLLK
jgi:alginate O-acetyltransferase complex protein AlgJ